MAGYKRAKGLPGRGSREGGGNCRRCGGRRAVWIDRGVDRLTSRVCFQVNLFLIIKEHRQKQHERAIIILILRSGFHQFCFPALCSFWFCEMTFRNTVVTPRNLTLTFQGLGKTGLFSDWRQCSFDTWWCIFSGLAQPAGHAAASLCPNVTV